MALSRVVLRFPPLSYRFERLNQQFCLVFGNLAIPVDIRTAARLAWDVVEVWVEPEDVIALQLAGATLLTA
jgi:hypothetical protein